MNVLILDSVSHEWDGAGGVLEIHGNSVATVDPLVEEETSDGFIVSNTKKISLEKLRNGSIIPVFAKLIGRARMYNFLSTSQKKQIPAIQLGDSQISTVVRDYFSDGREHPEQVGALVPELIT